MTAPASPDELEDLAPRVPWDSFRELFDHGADGFKQGDHVTIIAPTGGGKTTLAREVVEPREYVLGLFTKPRDPLIDELARHGWRRTSVLDIQVENGQLVDRHIAYHPVFRHGSIREKRDRQARAIKAALDYAFEAGGWCVLADESLWLVKHLRLADELEAYWFQGRTSNISLVAVAQRPRHVPLAALSQAEHLFLGHTGDNEDAKRLGEIGGRADTDAVRYVVRRLERYEFLYVAPHVGTLLRVKVADPLLPAAGPAPKP
jgi:hypothetical protein